MVRVLLVDDHPVVRAGLKALLETTEHVEVVGEASSGEEAVEKARTLEPDIVIMDLAMLGDAPESPATPSHRRAWARSEDPGRHDSRRG